MLTLALDASTYGGTVAVFRGAHLLATREVAMRGAHEERLMPAVAEALDEAGVRAEDLDRVVCGEGPGSFTSLRIAGSIAKGIAFARGIPLVPVSSLALVVGAAAPPLAAGEYVAALDALRDEAYVATCTVDDASQVVQVGPMRVIPNAELATLAARGARVAGPGHPFGGPPHARGVANMAAWLADRPPADLAGWEPAYGRLAEAQVRWEAAHGRPLVAG
ncbi:MAG TPA: tRNA (adenosine(37)-N6)-threonylcarbamoyltransferase complex dimerization subunit type 1 TsaB [Gemmatimonadaceae bacterium]